MLDKFKSSKLNHLDILLVIALSLLAAWSFILRGSLPRETDAELHVFRTAELGYALRAGAIYPRWAADFYYGYGYPIFNYYAPLTYYLANLLSLAIPGGAVFGTKAVFVLSFIIAGVSIYKIVSHTSKHSAGGIIAAASYLFAPYFYLIDSHLRGDLAEFLALAVGPLALWRLMAYYERPDRRRITLAALAIAALVLTHNLLALVYFALLVVYAGWRWGFENEIPMRAQHAAPLRGFWITFLTKTPVMLALPLVLGVMLAAFFWLPVGLERNAVQLGNLIGPGHFDYRNHFLSLGELFGPSLPLDLGAVNPVFRFNLGIGQWVLALLGIVGLIVKSVSLKSLKPISQAGIWGLVLIGLVGLMLPISLPVWDAVPLMSFMQFPWRLLGPAMLCVAILGGFSVYLFDNLSDRIQQYAVTGLTLLPLVLTLPVFVPPDWGSFGPTDQLAMLDFEINGLALGTTSTGDFVPAGVELVPGPNSDLLDSYRDEGPIDKVNRHTLPEGATVEVIRHRPISDLFTVTSPEAFTLRLYTFMFDGWKASIDGEPVSIEVAKPEGFITVPVPAGEHTVRVWLGTTPDRTLSTVLSLIGLGLLIIVGQFLPAIPPNPEKQEDISHRILGIGLAAFAIVAAVGGYLQWFQPHSEGLIAQPAQYTTHAYLQGGVDLIGYDIEGTSFQPGETIDLTLYWKAREPAAGNYQAFVHLTSIPAHTWGQSDKLNPGDYPTTRWPFDRYVRDPHQLVIPPGTPPGDYTLRVGLWNHGSGVRQLILAEDGEILGDSIELPIPITVIAASIQPDIAQLPLDVVIDQEVIEGITLLGAEVEPDTLTNKLELLKLTLYWQATDDNLPDYDIAIRLVNQDGTIPIEISEPAVDGRYPTDQWADGDVIRDVHSTWIDGSLPTGEYSVEIGVTSSEQEEPVNWLRVMTIERQLP